jgi:hypothetical protein
MPYQNNRVRLRVLPHNQKDKETRLHLSFLIKIQSGPLTHVMPYQNTMYNS